MYTYIDSIDYRHLRVALSHVSAFAQQYGQLLIVHCIQLYMYMLYIWYIYILYIHTSLYIYLEVAFGHVPALSQQYDQLLSLGGSLPRAPPVRRGSRGAAVLLKRSLEVVHLLKKNTG